jgi:hypothetical protein
MSNLGAVGDNPAARMITQSFADDVVVNAKELAQALRVSRWTVARWREEGYQFEFGNRSTPGHLKAWITRTSVPRQNQGERTGYQAGTAAVKGRSSLGSTGNPPFKTPVGATNTTPFELEHGDFPGLCET